MGGGDGIPDGVEAAVGGRCACGCGAVLDPAGPSAWFVGQDCQMRWQRTHADRPDGVLSLPSWSAEVTERIAGLPLPVFRAVCAMFPHAAGRLAHLRASACGRLDR